MRNLRKYISIVMLIGTVQICSAKLWLPSILSDNMVLQQESNVTIWGWSTATSDAITVKGSWNDVPVTTEAYQGVWSVSLPTPVAGGPYTVTIEGHEKLVINNVLIGEVWVASGQSNMEWTANSKIVNAEEEISNAKYPNIRFFHVERHLAQYPQDDTPGFWVECTPQTMADFSAIAYFFGRDIHIKTGLPIGLISSSWGGTPVETWIPEAVLSKDSELMEAAKKIEPKKWWPNESGWAYNAMIHPLVNFKIAGCIWYQGESNRQNATSYYKSFPLLIKSWREVWGNEFSFYFAQIAPFNYDAADALDAAIVRDAQLQTQLQVPKTGMAVTNDIGNLEDIHPKNKQEVGRRLALWALAKDYGVSSLEFSGPVYKTMEINKDKITLLFDHAGMGLMMKGKKLTDFTVAGPDRVFHPAKAKIVGQKVIVSAKNVKDPVAVRFAFTDTAQPNLYNAEGLPASAFRTDAWEFQE
ncbi:MAG: sialate O-acetylesterase [Maribacter sp.]|uniref:sialate O-acetylesterase n=1 Tax=Maribacter sp. TaxID=1897614 RepID=UPI003C78D4C4